MCLRFFSLALPSRSLSLCFSLFFSSSFSSLPLFSFFFSFLVRFFLSLFLLDFVFNFCRLFLVHAFSRYVFMGLFCVGLVLLRAFFSDRPVGGALWLLCLQATAPPAGAVFERSFFCLENANRELLYLVHFSGWWWVVLTGVDASFY